MRSWNLHRIASRLGVLLALFLIVAAAPPPPTPNSNPSPAIDEDGHDPTGHETTEGVTLAPQNAESVYGGARCPASAPVRAYSVVAINVEITLNRFLDYDPEGRMYVLEQDLGRVRQEEAQNKLARADKADPAVSTGLQGDAIQPLTLRVNQGECLQVTLKNELKNQEPASIHLHSSGWHLAKSGAPAIATNPDAVVYPSGTVTYEWMVEENEPEGTHYFHSHGNERFQTSHGMFGAVIVEPKGSRYLDPITGAELTTGWAAMIQPPQGTAFREFAIYYHEIGDERFQHLDKFGRRVVQVDPYTGSYRPGDRALNYRSEPFMNRLALQQKELGKFDKSAAYSSYAFGDPATPIARSYLGDPVKQRVIHAGSEVFHVHHVHGGAIRWLRQPGVGSADFYAGFDKHPPLLPDASQFIDSQSLGPSETFDEENDCGAGGCQQSVGDYLIHCHVAHHYLSGMWMIWRVYNTLQTASASQDGLPPLQELPDRRGQFQPAITSAQLVGKTVDWKGKKFDITKDNLAAWVEQQLPPSGVPKGYDASVLDWVKQGDTYLNERDSILHWADYKPSSPDARPPFYFDPKTGKLAYPFLRPHLGKRPPFAPNHGPAPFLDPIHQGTDPPQPGENGPWSVCPTGTQLKQLVIHAITLPISLNPRANLLDPDGALYVLKDQEDQVRATDPLQTPLAIRANAGEDCLDVILKSELPDTRQNGFLSKVDIHIHFVQFDIQASDGVDTGFNYEQSVRPFTVEGEKLVAPAAAQETSVQLTNTARFQPGVVVGVGMEQTKTFEIRRIAAIHENTLVFDAPLKFAHGSNEIVSTEFVRYRWYPDIQFGTAYFHDHVDALNSWRHGLFGALISEPPHSTYDDPHSGAPLDSGPLADIHTDANAKVTTDITGSFRELVTFLQDENPITRLGNSSGSSFNLRVEPLASRGPDPLQWFSSAQGNPATPLLEAFLGDPIVLRTLVGGTNDVHTLHVDGHWFRAEPYDATSPPIDTIHLGISERFDLGIPHAGGPQQLPGDYMYYNGRAAKLREGDWGILRVYDGSANVDLKKLPGHEDIPPAASSVCPSDAPRKDFALAAIDVPLPMLGKDKGKVFALQSDVEAIRSGRQAADPLVLHVNVGDCIGIHLRNDTSGTVSFHADMLAFDPRDSYGIAAGNDPVQAVAPGGTRTYTYYASPDVGETTALVRDWGNVVENPRLGLYGAIIVGPRGATYADPISGGDASSKSSWRVDVHPPSGEAYRDFSLFIEDEDAAIGTALMPYTEQVQGVVGLNYRAEPLAKRLAKDPDTAKVYRSDIHGDPATPLLEAFPGDAVRVHVLVPFSEQGHVFSIENHEFPLEPGLKGTTLESSIQVGALEAITLVFHASTLPGDYLYGDHREPYVEAGLWGLFRVYEGTDAPSGLRRLSPK